MPIRVQHWKTFYQLPIVNDVDNDFESTQKSKNYVIIANLKRKTILGNIRFTPFDIKFTRLSFENSC